MRHRATGGAPKPGDAWRFALRRYDNVPEGTDPLPVSSAHSTVPGFLRYEDWGRLEFR